MNNSAQIYTTFLEIRADLPNPIPDYGLDIETLRSLYESKLIYLNQLRLECFRSINSIKVNKNGNYTLEDYEIILTCIKATNNQLASLVLKAIHTTLAYQTEANS